MPTAGNYYVNKHGIVFSNTNKKQQGTSSVYLSSFPGESLTLNDATGFLLINSVMQDNEWLDFPNDGLILKNGAVIRHWYANSGKINCTITGACMRVESGATADLKITAYTAGGITWNLRLPIVGDETTTLQETIYNSNDRKAPQIVNLFGDMSGFKGKLKAANSVGNGWNLCGATAAARTLSGTVELVGPASFGWAGDSTVGTLTASGSGIVLEGLSKGALTVTSALTLPDSITLKVSADAFLADGAADGVVVLDASSATRTGGANVSLVVTAATDAKYGPDVETEATVAWTEDGKLVVTPANPLQIVKQRTSDSSGTDYGYGKGSSLNPNKKSADGHYNWSDDQFVHLGASYLVPGGLQLMTDGTYIDFGGDRLYIDSNGTLALCDTKGLKAKKIVAHSGAIIISYRSEALISGGTVEVRGETAKENTLLLKVQISNSSSFGMIFESEIIGHGVVQAVNPCATDSTMREYKVELKTPNPDYHGLVYTASSKTFDPAQHGYMALVIHDPLCLGGQVDSLGYKALIFGSGVKIRPAKSMTLDNTYGRGMYVSGGAVDVPDGLVFNLNQPKNWNGSLTKFGTGVLGMKSDIIRYSGGSQTQTIPADGTKNLLNVAEGWLMPNNVEACNGLALTFADGAGIRLNADTTDENLKAYGLRLTKLAANQQPVTAGETLKVSFTGAPLQEATTLGVLTVGDQATAEALCAKMKGVRSADWSSISAKFEVRENADSTWTVAVTVAPRGAMIFLK